MNIFPANINDSINIDTSNSENENKGYKDVLFDTKTKKIVIKDGYVAFATKKEQIKQWLYLLIYTEVGKYNVYKDTDFGIVFLYEMRGHEYYSSGFTVAQIKDELMEKIMENPLIQRVESIDIEIDKTKMIVSITLTVDDELLESEVIYNV